MSTFTPAPWTCEPISRNGKAYGFGISGKDAESAGRIVDVCSAVPNHDAETATCTICGNRSNLAAAIDDGWLPEVWDGDATIGPVCVGCTARYCHMANDGETVLNLFVDVAKEQRMYAARRRNADKSTR